jgi:hypothetical protein
MGGIEMVDQNISISTPFSQDRDTFSLVVGGPFYRLMCLVRLCDQDLGFLKRRLVALTFLAWFPLFLLSALQGQALADEVSVPFLHDFEAHLRFLVAIPLFLVAELVVHRRLQPVIREFTVRGLVPQPQNGKFQDAIRSSLRLLSSFMPELCILFFVYAIGILVIWNHYISLDVPTWYSTPVRDGSKLSIAGYWYVFVSLPIFQFLLLRWLFRVLVWWKFLWHMARIKLSLMPTHPDRLGGIGFIAHSVAAFAVLATAHMSVVAGQIANRIFYLDAKLLDFKVEIAAAAGYLFILFLLPLFFFMEQLAQAKRKGLREYGNLAQQYVYAFDTKWLRPANSHPAGLMGSADIQSLADLSNGYEPIRTMRLVPITSDVVMVLIVAMMIPLFPLLLTMMPVEELAAKLITLLF